ncbi:peptidase C48, SUMO/sentrin/Ubl1 [Tanacetum coccineum]
MKRKVVDFEKGSEKNKSINKQKNSSVLKGRATVRHLFEAMRGLSSERKKVIREMGFGDLIKFPIFEIPTKLVFYVVDILSTTNMTLECPMGDIVITPKTWKDQFRNVNKLTIKALSDVIIETKNFDYMFRMNILTLIANTLGSRENNSTVNFTVLKNVFEGDDVSDIDFDVLDVKRRLPAFKSLNTSLLKKREIAELQNDNIRIGEIQDDVGEGEEPNQKEELYEMLEENIHNILIEKSEIEEKINENLIKFQDDEKLLRLKQRMKDIFIEPEMLEYLSSSSSKSDDDNDDGSQLADENEERYRKEKHSNDVEIVAEEKFRNIEEKRTKTLLNVVKKKDEQETGNSKKDEHEMPEYLSSSSSKSNDDNDDGSQLADENEENPAVELTEDEKLLGRSIFITQEEEEEEVFNDDEGMILFRMNIQSLARGLEIDTSVIDVYVSILNYEEKFKMMNMKRHFFYTSMMVPGILEDKTTEIDKKIDAQYERFHEMLLIQMENDVEKMQMEDVELAFFPIIAHGHYYLIVFNIKTGKSVIIDNSESDATYVGKYKDNVEFVRSVFGRHLLMYQNTNADKILTGSKKATNLRMKWKTTKEKIDCGLYMIMHMELYEGSTAAQWKTSLLPEKDKNHRMQMDNLRSRIATKILLHDVNIYQKKMSDYAKKMTEAGEGGSNRE